MIEQNLRKQLEEYILQQSHTSKIGNVTPNRLFRYAPFSFSQMRFQWKGSSRSFASNFEQIQVNKHRVFWWFQEKWKLINSVDIRSEIWRWSVYWTFIPVVDLPLNSCCINFQLLMTLFHLLFKKLLKEYKKNAFLSHKCNQSYVWKYKYIWKTMLLKRKQLQPEN